jgi:hypothetical protein
MIYKGLAMKLCNAAVCLSTLFLLALALICSSAAITPTSCTAKYGSACPSCAGQSGRAYTNIAPFGCTVCWNFCKINIPLQSENASEQETTVAMDDAAEIFPADERLFIKIAPRLILSL